MTGLVCREPGGDRRDVVGGARIGRDKEDGVLAALDHLPGDELAAVPLGGGERFELVADARVRLVANL